MGHSLTNESKRTSLVSELFEWSFTRQRDTARLSYRLTLRTPRLIHFSNGAVNDYVFKTYIPEHDVDMGVPKVSKPSIDHPRLPIGLSLSLNVSYHITLASILKLHFVVASVT